MLETGPVRLQVKDAVVRFGDLHVLGPLSFEVRARECVVLLGPSGCGKSTLLAALAGLQDLASGHVQASEDKSPPGFVFQEPNLMGWANAADNVALPLALAGASSLEQKQSASAALDLVGLSAFAGARPKALSGGMAMRVALARALVSQPEALLLDEPFGAIDELGRRDLNDLVHKARKDAGVAVLFVTHSVEEAVYMADTILVLSPRPGKIIATIKVPDVPRDTAFLLSDTFAQTLTKARRALAMGVEYEVA
jgi:NitT/TauT family transport system ATP-binding protein